MDVKNIYLFLPNIHIYEHIYLYKTRYWIFLIYMLHILYTVRCSLQVISRVYSILCFYKLKDCLQK